MKCVLWSYWIYVTLMRFNIFFITFHHYFSPYFIVWPKSKIVIATSNLFGRQFEITNFQINLQLKHNTNLAPEIQFFFHIYIYIVHITVIYHRYGDLVFFCFKIFSLSWPDPILHIIAQCKEKQKAKIVSQVDQVNKQFSCCLRQ